MGSTFGMADIQGIVTLIGLVVALGGGFVAYGSIKARVAAHDDELKRAHGKADQALREGAEFRERVAREYATTTLVAAVEERIVAAIERLVDRFDRLFEGKPRP